VRRGTSGCDRHACLCRRCQRSFTRWCPTPSAASCWRSPPRRRCWCWGARRRGAAAGRCFSACAWRRAAPPLALQACRWVGDPDVIQMRRSCFR
jgi:hypothetical protein